MSGNLAANQECVCTSVRPVETNAPLANPYCGWGIWAGPRFLDSRRFSIEHNTSGFGDDAPLFSWVLVDWMWSDLEPEEGLFDWNGLDAVIAYWKARHKQFLVRLWVTTDPGWGGAPGNKACPDWLWTAGVKFHEYDAEGGARQRCPDYADASWERIYLPRLKRFLVAYRDRYHSPTSPVIMDQVMGFGDWGEWHTMWSHYPWPDAETKREVLSRVIQVYLDVLASGPRPARPVHGLSIAQVYDDDCGGETPVDEAVRRQALDVAIGHGLALSRHGFIDGLSGWPNDVMARYWRTNPLIAEANWTYEQVKNEKSHGTMQEHVDSFALWHSTYAHMYLDAGGYRRAMTEDRDRLERALGPGGIGYRYVLAAASWEAAREPGETLRVRQEWVNRNCSWCVYPYRLAVYLVESGGVVVWNAADEAFDPRSWVNGQTYQVASDFVLPGALAPGVYELRIGLVDRAGTPAVRLAIEGEDGSLRYRLGTVQIEPGGVETKHG